MIHDFLVSVLLNKPCKATMNCKNTMNFNNTAQRQVNSCWRPNHEFSIFMQVSSANKLKMSEEGFKVATYCSISSDIHSLILNHLNLYDQANLLRTHSILHCKVQQHVARIIAMTFYSLRFNVAHILTTLENVEGIIFGSLVWSLLNCWHFKLQSLNVIVPCHYVNRFIKTMWETYFLTMHSQIHLSMLSLPNVCNVVKLSGQLAPLNIVITHLK